MPTVAGSGRRAFYLLKECSFSLVGGGVSLCGALLFRTFFSVFLIKVAPNNAMKLFFTKR